MKRLKNSLLARFDYLRNFKCRRFSRYPAPQKVLILPRRYHLPELSFGGTTQYQPGGVSLGSSVGESEEFMSVREYRRGDPLRHIHWKSTGKTGKHVNAWRRGIPPRAVNRW